jgi:signal transduction histidine kinase
VVGVLAVVLAVAVVWPRVRPLPSGPLRIGYASDPPFHFPGDDGRPHGMAVDVVAEAARRIGLKLEWLERQGNSWMLVRDGEVDLWPLLAIRPERRGHVHISDPYLASAFYVLMLDGTPRPGPDYAGEVGLQELPLMQAFIAKTFPRATRRTFGATHLVVGAVCRGEVPVGVVSIGTAAATLRLPPAACQRPLQSVRLPGESIALGVGASLPYGWVADRLRREIADMAGDGTLGSLLMPYSLSSTAEVLSAIEVAEAHGRTRRLAWGMGLAGLALVVVLGLGVALLRANRRALDALAAQRALESRLVEREHLEAVGRLAGGVAHDFNNMLTVINGNCELLLMDSQLATACRGPVEEARSAATRAAGLVQQLLAYGRRQAGRPACVSVTSVLAETQPMLRRVVGESVEVVVRAGSGADVIRIDPGHLQQVAMNLSANARDAMPRGGRLTFAAEPVSLDGAAAAALDLAAGSYVRLRVTDTGVGMDEETRRHAFEPFFTTKPFGSGSGLGLATVYGVVTQAGGSATVESAPGRGTTFEFHFPAVAGVPSSPA